MKQYQICIGMEPAFCDTVVREGKAVPRYKHFGTLKCSEDGGNYIVVTAGWYDSAEDGYKKLAEFYNKLKLRER